MKIQKKAKFLFLKYAGITIAILIIIFCVIASFPGLLTKQLGMEYYDLFGIISSKFLTNPLFLLLSLVFSVLLLNYIGNRVQRLHEVKSLKPFSSIFFNYMLSWIGIFLIIVVFNALENIVSNGYPMRTVMNKAKNWLIFVFPLCLIIGGIQSAISSYLFDKKIIE